MTPKEKANELYDKYWIYFTHEKTVNSIFKHAKECALIAVDEILDAIATINEYDFEPLNNYWKEVKQELEKL